LGPPIPEGVAVQQMSLAFEPGLSACHRSLREFLATRIYQRGLVAVAGKLDVSPSHLTEKLAGASSDGKARCVTVDELEAYVEKYQDLSPIYYLLDKFARDPKVSQAEALAKVAKALDELPALLSAAGFKVKR